MFSFRSKDVITLCEKWGWGWGDWRGDQERVTVLQPVLLSGQCSVTDGLQNTSRRGRVKLYLKGYAWLRPDTKTPKYSQRKCTNMSLEAVKASLRPRVLDLELHIARQTAVNAGVTHAGNRICLSVRVKSKHYRDRKPFGAALGTRGMCYMGTKRVPWLQTFCVFCFRGKKKGNSQQTGQVPVN